MPNRVALVDVLCAIDRSELSAHSLIELPTLMGRFSRPTEEIFEYNIWEGDKIVILLNRAVLSGKEIRLVSCDIAENLLNMIKEVDHSVREILRQAIELSRKYACNKSSFEKARDEMWSNVMSLISSFSAADNEILVCALLLLQEDEYMPDYKNIAYEVFKEATHIIVRLSEDIMDEKHEIRHQFAIIKHSILKLKDDETYDKIVYVIKEQHSINPNYCSFINMNGMTEYLRERLLQFQLDGTHIEADPAGEGWYLFRKETENAETQ